MRVWSCCSYSVHIHILPLIRQLKDIELLQLFCKHIPLIRQLKVTRKAGALRRHNLERERKRLQHKDNCKQNVCTCLLLINTSIHKHWPPDPMLCVPFLPNRILRSEFSASLIITFASSSATCLCHDLLVMNLFSWESVFFFLNYKQFLTLFLFSQSIILWFILFLRILKLSEKKETCVTSKSK